VRAPTFATVCVGDKVRALGSISNDVMTATEVVVTPPRPQSVSGTVASVDGATAAGRCGTAHSAGEFTVTSGSTTSTVTVATTTTFKEHGVRAPTFAMVCVGDKVRAVGSISNDVVTATQVTVSPPRSRSVSGTVVSVGGTSSCGRSGMAGDFTVRSGSTTYTVDVGNLSTIFKEHGISAPSFSSVCAGDKVKARGTISNDKTMTASDVLVIRPTSAP
jgi:hypothetical protein